MNIKAIREALAQRARLASGVREAHAYWRDNLNPVAVVVMPGAIDLRTLGATGIKRLPFEIIVVGQSLEQARGPRQAQEELDSFLDDVGPHSLPAALEGDQTLVGTAGGVEAVGWRDYGFLEIGTIKYASVTLDVNVWAE